MNQSTSGNSLPPGLQGPEVTFGDTQVFHNANNFRTSPSSGSAVSFGDTLNDRRRSTFVDPVGAGEGGKQNNMSGGSMGMYQAMERRTTLPSEAATLGTSGSYQSYAQPRVSGTTTTPQNNGTTPFSFARPADVHGGNTYLPSEAMLSGSNQLPTLLPDDRGHTITSQMPSINPHHPSFTTNTYNHNRNITISNNFSVDPSHGHGQPLDGAQHQQLQQQTVNPLSTITEFTRSGGSSTTVTGVASNGLRPHQPPGVVFASPEAPSQSGGTVNGEKPTGNPASTVPLERQLLLPVEPGSESGRSPLFGHAFGLQGNGASVLQGAPLQHTFQSNVEYHTSVANNVEVRPGVSRTTIKLPRSKYTDESYFKDGVNRSTMFAPCEANVTLGCSGGLAAEEGVEKSWYNYYVYQESDSKRHFSTHMKETQAENEVTPTYIDPERARQRVEFLQKREQRARAEEQRQDALNNVSFAVQPFVTDSYTGEQMVAVQGHLAPMHCAKDLRLNVSDWDEMVENMTAGWSFDNMRVPWPFDPADRDKRIDMRAYNWFDRTNPYIKDDDAYQFMETASNFVDPVEHGKWRLRGGDNLWDQVLDVVDSIIYVD